MKCFLLVCAFVAYTTPVSAQYLGVSDAMAARVDAQAWRVDRLTKQFQTISDLADAARAADKDGGDTARHFMNIHMSGEAVLQVVINLIMFYVCNNGIRLEIFPIFHLAIETKIRMTMNVMS